MGGWMEERTDGLVNGWVGGWLGRGVDGWVPLGNVPRAISDIECRCEGMSSLSGKSCLYCPNRF